MAIHACRKAGKYVGICGQGPSDHPDLAQWLMEQGIESVSLNPDSVLDTWFFLSEEKAQKLNSLKRPFHRVFLCSQYYLDIRPLAKVLFLTILDFDIYLKINVYH